MRTPEPRLSSRKASTSPLTDWVDEAGPTVFFRIRITANIDEDRFHAWVEDLVEQFDGDVIEAGLADPLPQSA